MTEFVILVDEKDTQTGLMEKMAAHEKALLHRAFSVYIINNGTLMLQQRALTKYHCWGLWTNTTCSHPRDGETNDAAAHRRLGEEMGFDCPLHEITSFIYKTPFSNGLTEHEFLHVFIGTYDGEPALNNEEAMDWRWQDVNELLQDIATHPDNYTPWFRITLPRIAKELKARQA